MSDNPVPETLETIAAKIDTLARTMSERFDAVDERFGGVNERLTKVDDRFASVDERFTKVDGRFKTIEQQVGEMKAHLGVKIEAVETKVVQVYDVVIAMREDANRNVTDHKTFTKRLDDHDVRILALEKPGSATP